MFSRLEGPQPPAVQFENKPLDYYENHGVGVAGDIYISTAPIIGSSEIIQAAITPVVKVAAAILGVEQNIDDPKSIIKEFDLAIGEHAEVSVDETKPIARPKDNPDKRMPPYEGFADGTAQALVNFSIDDEERPASNNVLGSVVGVLLKNNGSAPIKLIARETGQSEDFIRGHGLVLPGIFKHSIDPNTKQEFLSVPPLAKQTYATNENGWTVVVPVPEDEATAAD